MMELKQYQERALGAFEKWLAALEAARAQSEAAAAAWPVAAGMMPPEVRDFPRKAWQTLADAGELPQRGGDPQTWAYVPRTDDAVRPVPHVCFKVPTGGGKTLLAAAALERMKRPNGLVLWIVPTRAIYQQTKRALWSREHPYRKMLDWATGERVKMLEKETPFTASDLAEYLCVMLLMLPAANRQNAKEFLRMFRDSGKYPTLFPDGDDVLSDQRLLNEHPDLEQACVNPELCGETRPQERVRVRRAMEDRAGEAQPVQRVQDAAPGGGAGRGAQGVRQAGCGERVRTVGEPVRPGAGDRAVGDAAPAGEQPARGRIGHRPERRRDDQTAGAGGVAHRKRLEAHATGSGRGTGATGRRGAVAPGGRRPVRASYRGRAGGAHGERAAGRRARPCGGRARTPDGEYGCSSRCGAGEVV